MKKFDPQRFRSAVMVIARMRAKKAVVAQLRAQGLKPQHYSASDLTLMAEEYIAKHCEDLITNAIADVWMFPEFSRYRVGANINKNAQIQNPQNSVSSALQISGAE